MRTRLVEFADHYWAEYIDKIERATAQLDDDAVWWRPNEHSNSIANLLLHLSGNLRQWVLGGLVGEEIERQTGQKVELASRVDGEILGGIVLQVGNKVLDASIRSRLEKLRKSVDRAA